MAKGYYRFHNGIYPRRLYVAVGVGTDFANEWFFSERGRLAIDWEGSDALTFDEIKERSSGVYGSLVVFRSKQEMTPKVMAHEAVHVMDSFMDVLGIERAKDGTNEHLAYLMGWIVGCMDEVKAGKAEIVKTDNRKRKDKK